MSASRVRGVLVFLLLAFGLAWAVMFGFRLVLGWSLANPVVQLGFAFAPAIAALLVRVANRERFADAGLRPRFRRAWPYYLVAWLGPYAMVAVTVAVAAGTGLWRPQVRTLDTVLTGVPGPVLLALMLVVVPLLAPVYWGEEFGWTSYLRLRLVPHRPVLAPLATGLIWAVWHFPLAFLGYISFPNVVLGLALWTVSFSLQEVVLSWLRIRSGTIWTTSVAHAGYNMVFSLLTSTLLDVPGGPGLGVTVVAVLQLVPLALAAAAISWTSRRDPPVIMKLSPRHSAEKAS